MAGLLLSDACVYSDVCSQSDNVLGGLLGLGWFAAVLAILVLAWRGQLFGCRRRRVSERMSTRDAA